MDLSIGDLYVSGNGLILGDLTVNGTIVGNLGPYYTFNGLQVGTLRVDSLSVNDGVEGISVNVIHETFNNTYNDCTFNNTYNSYTYNSYTTNENTYNTTYNDCSFNYTYNTYYTVNTSVNTYNNTYNSYNTYNTNYNTYSSTTNEYNTYNYTYNESPEFTGNKTIDGDLSVNGTGTFGSHISANGEIVMLPSKDPIVQYLVDGYSYFLFEPTNSGTDLMMARVGGADIVYSLDNGNTWNSITSEVEGSIESGDFGLTTANIALGSNSAVYTSIDGGATWRTYYVGGDEVPGVWCTPSFEVLFIRSTSSDILYLLSSSGTSIEHLIWEESFDSGHIVDVFPTSGPLYITTFDEGSVGAIRKGTTAQGAEFTAVFYHDGVIRMDVNDSGSILIANTSYELTVKVSTDSGSTWTPTMLDDTYNVRSVTCSKSGSVMYALADAGVYKSEDTGNTWDLVINSVDFPETFTQVKTSKDGSKVYLLKSNSYTWVVDFDSENKIGNSIDLNGGSIKDCGKISGFTDGYIYIDGSLVISSPLGKHFRIRVNESGTLSTVQI